MRCEVVAVGTELLLGQIVDSNSAWMGEQLALAGIDCHFQSKVGDNLERIVECIKLGLLRSDAVILCGGLGPTQDDITREAIADVMGVTMRRDQPMAEHIRGLFESRGRHMAENNLRQADFPEGSQFIAQMPGTAPGLICPLDDKVMYAVPGVPHEMRAMLEGTILPDLKRRAGVEAVIKSRVLRTWGQSESGLAEMLAARIDELDVRGNPTLAFQASGIEGLKVRITAKAPDDEAAQGLLDEEEQRVRHILGDLVFGIDAQNMEAAVLSMLRERGLSLAVAESLTGGLLGARLTSVAGASDTFRGGVVAYASDVKFDVLGVTRGPVVCESAATEMALGARTVTGADVGLATTGVAGPDAQEGHAPGTVFVGMALGERSEAVQLKLPGDRDRVRQYAVISVLNMLRLALLRQGECS